MEPLVYDKYIYHICVAIINSRGEVNIPLRIFKITFRFF